MKTSSLRFAACSCLLAFPPIQTTQTSPSIRFGPDSSLAAGLLVSSISSENLVKAPLNQIGTPPPWSRSLFPSGPDYSKAMMFPDPALAGAIKFGSVSTGNDNIPRLNASGIPDVEGYHTWMGVTVSVTKDTVGATGSVIDQRRHRLSGATIPAGADLFTYYYDKSQNLDPSLVNATVLEQSTQQIGLSSTNEVDGLDFGLGMISHARGTTTTLLFTQERFYFTLTRACIPLLPTSFTPGNQAPNAATVYKMEWIPANPPTTPVSGTWTSPEIHLTAGNLRLEPLVDELDALAVDFSTGSTIFSTKRLGTTAPSQLMIHGSPAGGAAAVFTLMNTAGVPVATKLGLSLSSNETMEEIDAVCVVDPHGNELASHAGFAVGTCPVPNFPANTNVPMGLSVCRSRSLAGVELLHAQISGFGPNPAADGFVAILLAFEDWQPGLPHFPASWEQDPGLIFRLASDETIGRTYALPPALFMISQRVTLSAISLDASNRLAQTWMSRLLVHL